MSGTNYRFNIEEWLPRFPLEERLGRHSAEIVTSPWHLCQNENLRRALHKEYEWGEPVLVDVFVMADGEPPDRHVTKIGGLPYRPRHVPWPTSRDGDSLVFLGQFNFCDSTDLTGELPGDVLLVFADEVYMAEHFHFEWQPMGLDNLVEVLPELPNVIDPYLARERKQFLDVIKQRFGTIGMELPADLEQCYERPKTVAPCYGHIYRTTAFPDAVPRDDSRWYPEIDGEVVKKEYLLSTYQATQIGAAPFFIQGDPGIRGRLICTLSSVQPAFDVDFPWINRPRPIPLDNFSECDKYLMIGDMGCIHIWIDENGEVDGNSSCY